MTPLHPLVQSRNIGSLRVHAIQAGGQKLDGGAMFGVVPKPLWERRIPPDERNRIQLGMRCLLIEHESGLILIDTGIGNKESAKFMDIYGVENAGENGRTALEAGLAQLGVKPEEISLVISTHLHFDHAGGNTYVDGNGAVHPTFPKARHVMQRGEYEDATHTNERTVATYLPANFVPLEERGMIEFIDGDFEIAKGIRGIVTPGHTDNHQSILIESGNERALYLADLVPTKAHLPLPWVMGYDLKPLVSMETKRKILKQAMDEAWTVIFEHDATTPWGQVILDGKAYGLRSEES
jgi:glyoxylase-like metal-dependent hydrolase (beta-lactamase superfamily II)